jgi:hypothetical protein
MSSKWWFRNQTRKAYKRKKYDEKYLKIGLPRCDKCFNCKEQHIKNYTEYICNLVNKNVNQSHFDVIVQDSVH